MTEARLLWLVTWLLRAIGFSVCLFFPIFFPTHWMAAAHAWLGLGKSPDQPIFEYLTRSLSAMYFAHGCVVLMVSTDVRRYLPVVFVIAGLNLFLGVVLLAIDLSSPMPGFWTWLEGPPIFAVGILLMWAANGLRHRQTLASCD